MTNPTKVKASWSEGGSADDIAAKACLPSEDPNECGRRKQHRDCEIAAQTRHPGTGLREPGAQRRNRPDRQTWQSQTSSEADEYSESRRGRQDQSGPDSEAHKRSAAGRRSEAHTSEL